MSIPISSCRIFALFCLTAFLPSVCAGQVSRVWSSVDGKFSVEATWESNDGNSVTLKKKSDGKSLTVPLAKLSSNDREYLASINKSSAASMDPSKEKSVRDKLEARFLRPSANQIVLTTEGQFTQAFKLANTAKTNLAEAQKDLKKLRDQQVELRKLERQGSIALAQINIQLANLPDNHPSYNQLVASNNATLANLKLIGSQLQEVDLQMEAKRKDFSIQQGEFMTALVEARSKSEEVLRNYDTLASDIEVQRLVKEYESATGKAILLAASRTFQSNVKKMSKLEALVLTETIPLRKDGETYFVPVSLGTGTEELIVDSGATSLCLPSSLASKLGIKPVQQMENLINVIARRKLARLARREYSSNRDRGLNVSSHSNCVLVTNTQSDPGHKAATTDLMEVVHRQLGPLEQRLFEQRCLGENWNQIAEAEEESSLVLRKRLSRALRKIVAGLDLGSD